MADDPTTGQAPASSDPEQTGQAPADPNPTTAATAATTTGQASDDWEPERAKATITTLRQREKDLDKQAKALAKELAETKARLQALEDEKLTEDQKRQKSFEQAQERLAAFEREQAEWQRERQEILTRQAVERAALRDVTDSKGAIIRPAFIDPSDAYALLDLAALEYDDDGRPVNVDTLLADLAKAKPHLLKASATTQSNGAVAAGSPSNPPRGKATDAPPKTHAQRYAEIYGHQGSIYDLDNVAGRGGGIRPPGEL